MNPITIDHIRRTAGICKKKAQKDSLYQEIKALREKFLEYKLDQADKWSWVLINDYIECLELGMRVKKQRAKAVEVCLKYGEDTLFWSELERTKRQRRRETLRMAHAARCVGKKLEEGGLTRKNRGVLSSFYRMSIDFRKKLLINPLSEKQRNVLWRAERILGVYYSDLSDKENGITRKEIENGKSTT